MSYIVAERPENRVHSEMTEHTDRRSELDPMLACGERLASWACRQLSVNRTRRPPSSVRSVLIWPPCASTTERKMARPSPRPDSLVV